ncbi:unnamed protein product [Caretta caretta]
MSRAYQPILPAASRYLQEKWDKAAYRQHRNKVDSASPAVDTQGLQPPSHLQLNLKRRQLDRERQAVRERDDRIHSARLVAIAQSRGRLDNWNSYSVRSLSSERRRWELAQIGVENQRLAGQLRQQQSEHAREPWERHWERVELIRNGIARYPRSLRAPQTVPKEQRQEALSSGFPSLGHEERRRANTVPLRMARGAAMPHRGAPGDVGPSPRQRLGQLWRPCPQRSARCEGTVPDSGAPQGTGASAQQTTTAAVLSPRGLASCGP